MNTTINVGTRAPMNKTEQGRRERQETLEQRIILLAAIDTKAEALAAVRRSGSAFRNLSPEWRADPDVVWTAIGRSYMALAWAAPDFKANKDFVLRAVRLHPEAMAWASAELRADPAFVEQAMQLRPGALKYANDNLQMEMDALMGAGRFDDSVEAMGYLRAEAEALQLTEHIHRQRAIAGADPVTSTNLAQRRSL